MIRICLFFCVFVSLLSSCQPKQELRDKCFNVFIPEVTTNLDSAHFLYKQYIEENPMSIMLNHRREVFSGNENIKIYLNPTHDSLFIYNITTREDVKIKLPFAYKMEISQLYFHNYDSIFVFFHRDFVLYLRDNGIDAADFILIDSSGIVNEEYKLDNIPNIYNGQTEPMQYLSPWFLNKSKQISSNIIYLPFSVYSPALSSDSFKLYDFRLLYAYDLLTKKARPLNVKFPLKEIGKKYNKNISTIVDYSFFDSKTIYYSFLHLPDVYKYDIDLDKSTLVADFPNFIFANTEKDSSGFSGRSVFEAPYFSRKYNAFFRKIIISDYKDYQNFSICQIFDSQMRLLGYSVEDSIYTCIEIDAIGEISVKDKTKNYLSHDIVLDKIEKYTISEIENSFLIQKPISKNQTAFVLDFNNISLETRLQLYLQEMAVEENSKIVMISTNILCGNCIDFLMQELQNNQTSFKQKNIKYLFYGKNITSAVSIISAYRVKRDFFLIDDKQSYPSFFAKDEMTAYSLINYNAAKLDLIQTDYSNLHEDFSRFVDR